MVEIDPNVRVRGNATYAGLEDVTGRIEVGQEVTVRESEAGVLGTGRVTQIDAERQLVYLSVDWSLLHLAAQEELDKATADAEWFAANAVVFPQSPLQAVSYQIIAGVSSVMTGVSSIMIGCNGLLTLKAETSAAESQLPDGRSWILSGGLVGAR
jgi:hypothetical protein